MAHFSRPAFPTMVLSNTLSQKDSLLFSGNTVDMVTNKSRSRSQPLCAKTFMSPRPSSPYSSATVRSVISLSAISPAISAAKAALEFAAAAIANVTRGHREFTELRQGAAHPF